MPAIPRRQNAQAPANWPFLRILAQSRKNLDVDPHARNRATVFQPRHCLLWHSARPLLSEVPDQVGRCRCEAALDPMSRTNRLRDNLPFARPVRIARTWALTTNIGSS